MNVTRPDKTPLDDLIDDFRNGAWSQSLLGGLVAGVVATSLAVSLAGLVFSGPLSSGFGVGVAASLLGGGLVAIVSAWTSSSPGMVAGVQDSSVAIVAVATAGIATTATSPLPTALAIIVLVTVGTGAGLWLAGRYRLGRILRYVPYPVLLGFVGATGLVVLLGAGTILVGAGGFSAAMGGSTMLVWVPGVLLALALLVSSRWSGHPLALPLAIVAATTLTHLVRMVGGSSVAAAQESGHLLGPFPTSGLLDLGLVSRITDADWSAVGSQSAVILTAVMVGVLSFLLNAPAIEELTDAEIDVDADMRPVGLTNVFIGLFGSLPGYVYLSDTVATGRIAGLRRSSGLIAGLISFGAVAAGPRFLGLIPTLVVGGVLAFIGLTFLFEALVDNRTALNRYEFGLIISMIVVVPVVGFGTSIALGLAGAVALFAFRYATVDVIRVHVDLVDYPSDVERNPSDKRALHAKRGIATVIDVHGFLFFGTAAQVGDRLIEAATHDVQYLVVGLGGVNGMDGTVGKVLVKAARDLAGFGRTLVVTGLDPGSTLTEGLIAVGAHPFGTLAEGARWVEDQLLGIDPDRDGSGTDSNTGDPNNADRRVPLEEFLSSNLPSVERGIISYFERQEVGAGDVLIREGSEPNGVIYLEQGDFAVTIGRLSGDGGHRIRILEPGTVVGEIGWYDGSPATANVEAMSAGIVWFLRPEGFQRLEADAPYVAAAFHRMSARVLAGRVRDADRSIRALLGGGATQAKDD